MKPRVSIILPTYNRLKYLRDTIESVFAQTFGEWELILADDGSDADTLAYLAALESDSRVSLLRLAHSGNPPSVRNAALREARGHHVAFIDSDDLWLQTKLDRQIAALQKRPERLWSYTGFTLVDELSNPLTGPRAIRCREIDGWILQRLLRREAMIVQSGVMATRALLENAGGYDAAFPICGDYDLWLRLAQHSEVDCIAEPLVLVRRHADHYCDDVAACSDFQEVLDKMQRSIAAAPRTTVTSPRRARLATLVRRQRADASAVLANSCAANGARMKLLKTLFSSASYAWRYEKWWTGMLRAIARACAPAGLQRAVRRYRSPNRLGPA